MIATYGRAVRALRLGLLLLAACSGSGRAIDDASERDAGDGRGPRDRTRNDAGPPASVDEHEPDASVVQSAEPPIEQRPPAPEDTLTDNPLAKYGIDSDPPHPVFDQSVVHDYQIEVDPDEWAHINETAYLEEYIPAKLTYQGQVFANAALRFKGFRGSLYNCFLFDENGVATGRICDKLSLKLSFDEYDPDGRFFGLKKLNFHAMNTDPTRLRERLAYFLFRRFGVPAPRAVNATLTVNGEPLGLYALVEQVDGRFTRARFPDGGEGNLYKERWPTSSADPEYFRSGLETNSDDPATDVSAMAAFAADVRAASDDTIEAVLRAHTDFDALMRYLAVDRAIQLWDGITAFRCRPESEVPALPPEVLAAQTPALGWETCQNKNFYFYEASTHDKIWLVAWDTDISFAGVPNPFPPWDQPPDVCEVQQSGRPPGCDPLIRWFATSLRPQYLKAGNAFLQDVFRGDVVETVVRAWSEQIQPYLGIGDLLAVAPEPLFDSVTRVHGEFEAEMAR